MTTLHIFLKITKVCDTSTVYGIQCVPKKTQTIENDLLLAFQWPSTKLNVKSAKY